MNKKEIVENIKKLIFNKEEKEEKLEFVNAKLEDGTIVMADGEEFEVGGEIYVVDEEGNKELAPDGEHVLEDGSIVKTEEGKILEILEAESDLEEKEEEMESEESETELEKEEEEMEKDLIDELPIMDENEELKKEVEMLKEELKDLKDKMTEKEEMEKEEFSKISNLEEATKYVLEFIENSPASEKIEVKKQGFYSKLNEEKLSSKEQKRKEIAKIFANNK